MGYAEGGLVNEPSLSLAPLTSAPLTSAPNAFAPSLVNPMYAGVNDQVAAFQAQQPVYGSSPLMPREARPTFGAMSSAFADSTDPTFSGPTTDMGTGTYNFVAPVPQVRAPLAADNSTLDFYTRQAQLQESLRAADRAQNQIIKDALVQTQAAQRSAAAPAATGGASGTAGGGTFAANAANITRLYQEILGRNPDPTGFATFRDLSDDVIRQGLIDSPEYKNRLQEKARNEAQQAAQQAAAPVAGGIGGIAGLYQELLGRAPDPSGLSSFQGRTDEQIRQAILQSPEYQSRPGGIENIYQQMLGRAPDPSGLASNAGRTDEQIRQAVAQSAEYQASPAGAAAAAAAPAPERQYITIDNESGVGYYEGPDPVYEDTWYSGDSGD